MASSSISHAPPLTLLVVSKPSNLSVHEPLAKKPKRSYDKFRISKFLGQPRFLGQN
jgi:hypothetical protein